MIKSLFSKLSGENQQAQVHSPNSQSNPATDSLLRVLEEKRKTDPLIGAKIGGNEIFQRLLESMKDERGVHIESLLCALGALAGYSCQANLRVQAAARGMQETAALVTVTGADGKKYFFGDPLNQVLAAGKQVLPLDTALQIVMEAAIPMSKANLEIT